MILVLLIGLGLILGSFVNALVWRLHAQDEIREKLEALEAGKSEGLAASPRSIKSTKSQKDTNGQIKRLTAELEALSIARGRSMCSLCGHRLTAKDLIPFFSWLWLRGKCRYCRKPIADPPVIELVVPGLFVVSYLAWPMALQDYGLAAFILWLVFIVGFVALSLYDIRWFLLPDRIVWPLVGLAVLQVVVQATLFDGGWQVIVTALWGVVLASGVFLVLFLIAERLGKEWIGFGDVKLGLVLGLLVGGPLPAILVLYLASLLGLLASLPGIIRHRMTRTSLIPFGPFLMAACILVVLFGGAMTDWLDMWLIMP